MDISWCNDLQYFILIAISYVWGDISPFTATKNNIRALCKPGALEIAEFRKGLPKTVLHAIALTESLMENYLWCDALCIVQDDENKHEELANMASIYANASLTIIAANGEDANYGLLGLPGISGPRSCHTKTWSLGEFLKLQQVPGAHATGPSRSTSSIWKSRAWTWQEGLFSRRQLIFHDDMVSWQWAHGARHEHVFWPSESVWAGPRFFSLVHGAPSSSFTNRIPDMDSVFRLIRSFNVLDFSYPEDALTAFAGIMTAVGRSCDGGFISGLPALYFNLALLWNASGISRRRVSRNSTRNSCLPSWSWAGWESGIDFISFDLYDHDAVKTLGGPIRSDIVWRHHQAYNDEGTAINFSWLLHRTRFLNDTSEPVPLAGHDTTRTVSASGYVFVVLAKE